MKNFRLILILVLIKICLFPPAQALCQTVIWTSSHPDIVSVDENTGAIEMINEPDTTTDVTITATAQQNGKTVMSIKTIEVDACTSCFPYQAPSDTQARTYCGVRLSNGQCWLDRNIGASRVATGISDNQAYGINYARGTNACPSGWKTPVTNDYVALARNITGNNSLTKDSSPLTNAQYYGSDLKLTATGYGGTATGSASYEAGLFLNYPVEGTENTQLVSSATCAARLVFTIGSGSCYRSWLTALPIRCIRN